jgi:DNA-binding CsgD family transcriptional regulator
MQDLEKKPIAPLSPQQKRILQLLVDGYTAKEIAYKMRLAATTVRKHQRRACLKLGATTQDQMIAFAVAYECVTVDIYV